MYLTAPREDRLRLLAGLMDSDGHLEHVFDFITKSRDLANDVVFLARSLGFMAYAREKYCSCQTGAGAWYYRVGISGELSLIPCRRKRHSEAQRPRRMKKDVLRTGFAVEAAGEGDFYGFMLDGNHLYVDGNFFVHHNSGKSLVLSDICRKAANEWKGRVLVLTHVRELVEQNAEKLRRMLGARAVGIHSAGLNRRDLDHPVIAAGIQSVFKKAHQLGVFNIVIVDEAQLLPPDGDGIYLTFLRDARVMNPHVRVIGLTATPYRMTTGSICSENGILNHICYEIGVADLIAQGYLSPLISKAGRGKADVSGLHLRGGEFIPGEAEALMDAEGLVRSAVAEIVEATRDRRACLIFCAGVKHGEHVARVFHEEHGIECGFLDGHTSSGERNRLVARFRGETAPADLFGESQAPLKYLANVNVLTTGFDAPHIDCVAMLRPTNSPGLYYQQIGRGFRLAPGKENCLVLDFADNIVRHGPVDLLRAGDRLGTKGDGSAPAKECPSCQTVVHASLMVCPQCGFEFPKREAPKHNAHASAAPVISTEIAEPLEFEVLETTYSLHRKRNAPENHPPSLCVNHRVGSYSECFAEYVCPEHTGYAREKFESWWRKRSTFPPPRTVKDAIRLANDGCLARTHGIRVQRDANGFDRICAWALGEKPVLDDDFLAGEREAQGEPVPATVEADPWGDEDDIPF